MLSDKLRRFVIAVFLDIACAVRSWPDGKGRLLWPRGVIMEGHTMREKSTIAYL